MNRDEGGKPELIRCGIPRLTHTSSLPVVRDLVNLSGTYYTGDIARPHITPMV